MSDKLTLLVQYFVAICVFVLVVHGEKRLLLSDPDVINNRLLEMEREIQTLTAELKSNKQDAINEVQKLTAETTNKMASFTTELESKKRQTTHQMTDLASKITILEQSSSGKFLCGIFIRY